MEQKRIIAIECPFYAWTVLLSIIFFETIFLSRKKLFETYVRDRDDNKMKEDIAVTHSVLIKAIVVVLKNVWERKFIGCQFEKQIDRYGFD